MDDLKQQFGKIDVNDAVIAQVVGFAVTESYGIVGMVSQRAILDGIGFGCGLWTWHGTSSGLQHLVPSWTRRSSGGPLRTTVKFEELL